MKTPTKDVFPYGTSMEDMSENSEDAVKEWKKIEKELNEQLEKKKEDESLQKKTCGDTPTRQQECLGTNREERKVSNENEKTNSADNTPKTNIEEKKLIICKICSEEVKKGTLTYGLEQFLFWDNEKEAQEHFKRKHPEIAKECRL